MIQREIETIAIETYDAIRTALFAHDWGEVDAQLAGFFEALAPAIPSWYEDELAFTAMQLWAAGRPQQVLRHFALFFDKVIGRSVCWDERDALPLAEASMMMA